MNANKLKSMNNIRQLNFLTQSNHNGRLGLLGGELTYYKTLEEYMKGDISLRWSDRLFFDFDIEDDRVDDVKSTMKKAISDLEASDLRDKIKEL